MPAKVTSFLITMIANIAAGVAIFFMMLLAMNGFNGGDAEWGLGAYILLAAAVTLLMSTCAVLLVHLLSRKQISPIVSSVIAIPLFSLVGAGLQVVCCVIGIAIADYVRVNY